MVLSTMRGDSAVRNINYFDNRWDWEQDDAPSKDPPLDPEDDAPRKDSPLDPEDDVPRKDSPLDPEDDAPSKGMETILHESECKDLPPGIERTVSVLHNSDHYA